MGPEPKLERMPKLVGSALLLAIYSIEKVFVSQNITFFYHKYGMSNRETLSANCAVKPNVEHCPDECLDDQATNSYVRYRKGNM